MPADVESLIAALPDAAAARRFLDELAARHPREAEKLGRNAALLSDAATLAAFSPLLATTMLQHPDYLWWLDRRRKETGVRSKDELMEELGRFALTHTSLSQQALYAAFRRRELLRIYLRDIRRLTTIAEITEEISNLADAILETALGAARREMDNRYGTPLETDEKGRSRVSGFCVAALGKLGSRELNYSSDIDLLFMYSSEGNTSGRGTRGAVTNREYFVKLAEYLTKLVGDTTGEGGAYRVDLRLRPHGTLGALATSVDDLVRYYRTDARAWERQVMIRSRACAGDVALFRQFFAAVEGLVFSKDQTVETALDAVRRSKEKIDLEAAEGRGYNVKVGRGGIREIEFLAQALQLAHGGRDPWLRSPHTLISLSRLADRGHITSNELTQLAAAYDLLRRTEHVLQMENGLQTHTVPVDHERRALLSRRMALATGGDLERALGAARENVSRTYARVFGEEAAADEARSEAPAGGRADDAPVAVGSDETVPAVPALVERLGRVAPRFAARLAADPELALSLAGTAPPVDEGRYKAVLSQAVDAAGGHRERLLALRRAWSRLLLEIVVWDAEGVIDIAESKRLQTELCEAAIDTAAGIVRDELCARYGACPWDLGILALGKLGGRGLDYDSDLDLLMVYDGGGNVPAGVTHAEYYSRAVELFVTTLSAVTREGSLYRVDLRLRPYGSKGLAATPRAAFHEYMLETAAIWELLAFVKLRAVGGDIAFALGVEAETRHTIHERAAALDPGELARETRKVRFALEKQRSRSRRSGEVDIKYGPGGMLDVYFAMRYLQLRDNVPDDPHDRGTRFMLDRLHDAGSLDAAPHAAMIAGYTFLSTLDHNLRLTVGRTTRVPTANKPALAVIAERMSLSSEPELLGQLTLHLIAIREAFESVLEGSA